MACAQALGGHPFLGGPEVEHAQRGRVALRLVVAQGPGPRPARLMTPACNGATLSTCSGFRVLASNAHGKAWLPQLARGSAPKSRLRHSELTIAHGRCHHLVARACV